MDGPLPGEATCDTRRVELFQGVRLHRLDGLAPRVTRCAPTWVDAFD
jgi:hypothetical protein